MNALQALTRLAKWRTIYAGWQLGTRVKGDPECDAVRDHREATLIMRAEMTAIVGLLVDKGLISTSEWQRQVGEEALILSDQLEQKFRGARATDDGIVLDERFVETAKNWRP